MNRYIFKSLLMIITLGSWLVLMEDLGSSSVLIGISLVITIYFLTKKFVSDSDIPPLSFSYAIKCVKYGLKSIISIYTSSFSTIKAVILNKPQTAIVKTRLPSKANLINALVCNSITITPGTISLEKKKEYVYVLLLNSNFEDEESLIKEIESNYSDLKQY